MSKQAKNDEEADHWGEILKEAGRTSLDQGTLLVVGDRQSGKTTLLTRLGEKQGDVADDHEGVALEYTFVDVKDPDGYTDEPTRLHVWTSDGDPTHEALLDVVVTPAAVKSMALVVVVDLARPWCILETTEKWLSRMQPRIEAAWLQNGENNANAAKKKLEDDFKRYRATDGNKETQNKDSQEGAEGTENEPNNAGVPEPSDAAELFPLEDGVLEVNIGVPVVFVTTRTDVLTGSDYVREYSLRSEHFDLVQRELRRLALKYGAGIVYTSAKTSRNQVVSLVEYCAHRVVGFSYGKDAEVVDKENVFIPAGWDSLSKVEGLYTQETKLSDLFSPPAEVAEKPKKTVETPSFEEFLAEQKKRITAIPEDTKKKKLRDDVQHVIYNTNKNTVQNEFKPNKPGAAQGRAASATAKDSAAADFFKNILAGNRGNPQSAAAAPAPSQNPGA